MNQHANQRECSSFFKIDTNILICFTINSINYVSWKSESPFQNIAICVCYCFYVIQHIHITHTFFVHIVYVKNTSIPFAHISNYVVM